MNDRPSDRSHDMEKMFSRFAAAYIADRDLRGSVEFPFSVWKAMGEEGLLGLSVPERFGGMGGSLQAVSRAGEALVREGHNLGIAVSWLIHQITAGSIIARVADEGKKELLLPGLARGGATACLAVSEPGTGAHPKHLKTKARRHKEGFVITGEKTYLTNGPIADLFIIIAVTAVEGGKNRCTAFLVPRETPGLSPTPPLDLPFLRPSPHGGIILDDCPVTADAVLGPAGTAYEDMVVPLREYEDILTMGPVLGAMEYQLKLLAGVLAIEAADMDRAKGPLGELRYYIDSLRILAREAARLLDGWRNAGERLSLTLFFRTAARTFQERIAAFRNEFPRSDSAELRDMAEDLNALLAVAGRAAETKGRKLGESVLAGVDRESP
ncbi:MAG: acyl-CoA/acyl-ACP dehydrogenase [Deltaproteobacteria bacterium]|nr:acyl-CoA/acyl-ACP dehydrogenase [Deltaproteobacteria bacterium]